MRRRRRTWCAATSLHFRGASRSAAVEGRETEDLPLHVLYEDADVVVVDKAAGMVVHAGAGNHQGTLVNALLHHFESLSSVGGDLRPGIVHRLDRDTSGVLVVARTDQAHRALAGSNSKPAKVEKVYLALSTRSDGNH